MAVVIGVTGGIASGKSTVLKMMERLGAQTISADDIAREVIASTGPAYPDVVQAFGNGILNPETGEIDRAVLGKIVFGNPDARRLLESLTHPHILSILRERLERFRQAAGTDPAVLAVEIPLLFECGLEDLVDEVVVVKSEQENQVSRLTSRNLSREESLRRIRSQMPIEAKAARARWVIENDSDLQSLEQSVRRIWGQMCLPCHD